MNNNKRSTMNKFKKLGLTALAGSLAAVTAAQAADYSIGGAAVVTYMDDNKEGSNAVSGGNAIGQNTNVDFSASGELENGFTVSMYAYMNDGNGGSISSTAMTLGMGDLGSIVFAEAAGTRANGIDDKLPYAYEEAYDVGGAGEFGAFGAVTNSGSIEYQTPNFELGDFSLGFSAAYDPQGGVANRDHDAVTASSATYGAGKAYTATLSGMGATVYLGSETVDGIGSTGAAANEYNTALGAILYSIGPVSLGYQEMYVDSAAGARDYEGDGYSIAFAVNDDLTLQIAEIEVERKAVMGTAAVTEKNEQIGVSYTTGGMTFQVSQVDVSNYDYNSALSGEHLEIALSFAF